jgi:hypothetical protein
MEASAFANEVVTATLTNAAAFIADYGNCLRGEDITFDPPREMCVNVPRRGYEARYQVMGMKHSDGGVLAIIESGEEFPAELPLDFDRYRADMRLKIVLPKM